MLNRLSQGHLNGLDLCPRRFQHVHLDQLLSPTAPEQQQALDWGTRFHLLMQQHDLGLPVETIEPADPTVQACFRQFMQTAPEVFAVQPGQVRHSEHRRTLELEGVLLTAVYDLLVLHPDRALIYDWKTHLTPQSAMRLAQDWQTRLYCFVLAETSAYLPEQISFTYWFVRAQAGGGAPRPQHHTLPYSTTQHEKTRQALSQRLAQLSEGLAGYREGRSLPQVPEELGRCDRCPFAIRCRRGAFSDASESVLIPNLADIAEVVL
ncbi:MAG: PD-(D/E)XK nuclease family protein [Kaiparowitsia implicata GSE-PSE-MK54-09C]|jgi:hypothetical protein|nr:PD-(D/E)XK nuclease family protein [Kaiparowitsia implicata GSE-PSE-MK54-09C]